MSSSMTGHAGEARCSAAGSTRQALLRACSVVEVGYFPNGFPLLPLPSIDGRTCSSLRAQFDSRRAAYLSVVTEERTRRSLVQALKSCYRFFDAKCHVCDRESNEEACRRWIEKSTTPASRAPALWSEDPVRDLALEVNRLLGPNWGKGLFSAREKVWVPDQNGCTENPRSFGGTLGVPDDCPDAPKCLLRLATAKTKGKTRVVTCQPRETKRILQPVHDVLYRTLVRRKYVVCGEFNAEWARYVADDLRKGEYVVSADYSDATGNIDPAVTFAIVQVLARSKHLSEEERDTMLEVFNPDNLWVDCGFSRWARENVRNKDPWGREGPFVQVKRGQMMGALLSFPILCLINKAAYNLSMYRVNPKLRFAKRAKRSKGLRRQIINGDDTAFCSDPVRYAVWRDTVSCFGLVVNEEKTGVSTEFVELNSRSWHISSGSFVTKPVLSSLRINSEPGCVLTALYKGLKSLGVPALMTGISLMRHEISFRGGVSVSQLPPTLHNSLIKRRWYRTALAQRKETTVEVGEERCLETVKRDVRPSPECTTLYNRLVDSAMRGMVAKFDRGGDHGQYRNSFKRRFDRSQEVFPTPHFLRPRYKRTRPRWVWLWPRVVLNCWERFGLPLAHMRGMWQDDHPHLSTTVEVRVSCTVPPPLSLLADCVRPDGVCFV